MSSTRQNAVFITEIGKPVELGTRDIPSPGKNQVLIKMSASMIIPHDTYSRDWGLYIADKLPFVPGANLAGTITTLGPEVTAFFQKGDRVFGLSNLHLPVPDQQGLQEYAILDATAIAHTPAGITDEAAATLPTNLLTSWVALFTKEGFAFPPPFTAEGKTFDYSAQHVVILGGGTNVGRFAVQLAALAGVGTVVVVAGKANTEALKNMGATHVLDRHLSVEEVAKEIHGILGGERVVNIYDCANMEFTMACALMSPASALSERKTKLRTLLPLDAFPSAAHPECDAAMLDARNDQLHPHQAAFWEHVTGWLEQGKVLPTSFRVVDGLADVKAINVALDEYADFARSGADGVVVKI